MMGERFMGRHHFKYSALMWASLGLATAQAANVLMVGANADPSFGDDLAVYDHLTEVLGLDVTYMAGDAATREDGAAADLIIISSTLASGAVRSKFTGLEVPMLNWEEAIMDGTTAGGNLAMGTGAENGTANPGSELRILQPNHPLAAGLNGLVEFATDAIPRPYITGAIAPGVTAIASIPGATDIELSPSGTGMHLGSTQTGANPFTGLLDEMAVWDRALSFQLDASQKLIGGEVLTVYQQGIGSLPAAPGGLVGYWSFDDVNDQTEAADASGNGYTGLLIDGASKTSTDVAPNVGGAGALELDGTGNVDILDIERPGGELTYSFWFKADSGVYGPELDTADPRVDFFYGNGGGGGTVRPHLSANRNGRPMGLYVNANGDLASPIEGTTSSFTSDQWHHLVITWDGVTGNVFVDGELDNQVRLSDALFAITAVEPGGLLTDGTEAPARIVNFPIQDVGFASLTEDGLALFDAAITWLLNAAPAIPGDFDGDGVLSEADINLLSAAVAAGTNAAPFDLNADQFVNSGDIDFWVVDLKRTWLGDANLDGEFNSGDFVTIFQEGKFETNTAATWGQGDWNGDLRFNTGDFVVAFQGGGFELGPRPAMATVPEPAGILWAPAALFGFWRWRRR
jgi:hypothetical protein